MGEFADNLHIREGKFQSSRLLLDAPAMIQEVIDIYRHEADRTQIRLRLNQPSLQKSPQILCDAVRTSHLFENLLSKVLRLTEKGGAVSIDYWV